MCIAGFRVRENRTVKRGLMGLRVTINGEERRLKAPVTVQALLAELGLEATKIAVERNREIVPRSRYGDMKVTDGDRLEIVQFIGGGS
jgi:thiazole synthase